MGVLQAMIRDENWFDAVGKNDWRQEQIEKREREAKLKQEKENGKTIRRSNNNADK